MEEKEPGFEYLDDTPVAVPVKFSRAPMEVQRLKNLIREVSLEIANQGGESFEESLDFDIEEDEPLTTGELRYMQEERLLTEAESAAKIQHHRNAVNSWRQKYGRSSEAKSGGDKTGSDVPRDGSRGSGKAGGKVEGRERGKGVSRSDSGVAGDQDED